jgi:endonuclease/exonuclease/phosphatase family metal-dependent hydrolase
MPLRVLTYNIWDGGGDRLPLIRDVIRAQQPDLVALEEANDRHRVEWLAGELGMALAHGEANSAWHIAWLSRLPVTQSQNHKLPILGKTLLELDVEWEGESLQLFATHLDSERTVEGEERRAGEVGAILQVMLERGDARQLLVGDFNALAPQAIQPALTSLSQDARVRAEKIYSLPRLAIPLVLEAGYFDSYQTQHPHEQGYTFKSWEPVARFDYIFASREMAKRLRACDRVTGELVTQASDHLPVQAEFA